MALKACKAEVKNLSVWLQGRLPLGGVSTEEAGQGDSSGGLVHSVVW